MHWIPGTVPGAWHQHLHWKHNSEWAYCWSPTKAGPDEQRQPFTPEVKLLLVSKRTWEQKSVERKKEKKKTCKIGWCRSWLPEDVRKKNILLQLTVRWTVIGSDPTLSALDSWRELKSNSWLREEQSLSHSFYFFSVCVCVDGGVWNIVVTQPKHAVSHCVSVSRLVFVFHHHALCSALW